MTARKRSPKRKARPKSARTPKTNWLLIIFFITALLVLFALFKNLATSYQPALLGVSTQELSEDQQKVVDKISWPDYFLIIFSVKDPKNKIEVWNYEELGFRLAFVNGNLKKKEEIRKPIAEGDFVNLKPNQFNGTEDIAWFKQNFGNPSDEKENGELFVINFDRELTAVFKDNKLISLATYLKNPDRENHVTLSTLLKPLKPLNLLNLLAPPAYAKDNPFKDKPGLWDRFKEWVVDRSFIGKLMDIQYTKSQAEQWDKIGNDAHDAGKAVDAAEKFHTEEFPEFSAEAGKEAVQWGAGALGEAHELYEFVKDLHQDKDKILNPDKLDGDILREILKSLPTPIPTPVPRRITGRGSFSGGGHGGSLTLSFSSAGGGVSGSFGGLCSGSIGGGFSGGNGGRIKGSMSGVCTPAGSLPKPIKFSGGGGFSGTVHLNAGSASGRWSGSAGGKSMSGSWRVAFTPYP